MQIQIAKHFLGRNGVIKLGIGLSSQIQGVLLYCITIINISYAKKSIIFEIEVKAFLTECQCEEETFDYVDTTEKGTIIRLEVVAWDDDLSEEEKVKTVIPFQLAYAISIHKAQGLEYKSVKIVIPSSNAEKITHSIFYTAITRAKEKLKIF